VSTPKSSQTSPIQARRLAAQLLAGTKAASVTAVVERLLAVQSQDIRGMRLTIRARSRGLDQSDVDNELEPGGSLVVSWLNRGTLHLVHRDDYWWMHRLTTPQLANVSGRQLENVGVTPRVAARGVDLIAEALADGPQTRANLRQLLTGKKIPAEGQAFIQIAFKASIEGVCVRGAVEGIEQPFVLAEDWLGKRPVDHDEDADLARLARRYLAGHAPASPADLAKWTGITLGRARRGFDAIAAETEAAQDGLFTLVDGPRLSRARVSPTLLGPFDELLMGWASREPVLDGHNELVTSNGMFRSFALVDGRAAGTWSWSRTKGVQITPFTDAMISAQAMVELQRDARDVERFLGPSTRVE
jgi:Winged helix DNA-binding domain